MKKIFFLMFFFLIFIDNASAESANMKIVCPKDNMSVQETINCDVIIDVKDKTIEEYSFKINTKNLNIDYNTIPTNQTSCMLVGNSLSYQVSNCEFITPIDKETKIGTLKITAPSKAINSIEQIELNNIELLNNNQNIATNKQIAKQLTLAGNINIDATSNANLSINCKETIVEINKPLVCDINLNTNNTIINKISFTINGNKDSNVTYKSEEGIFNNNQITENDNKTTVVHATTTGIDTTKKIGTITILTNKPETKEIIINDIKISNTNYANIEYTQDKINKLISIEEKVSKSTNNTLTSIKLNKNEIPEFSSEKMSYEIELNTESVEIEAIKQDDKSTVSGDIGIKQLNYGENLFEIKVTSEIGTEKTYSILIKRIDQRSNINTLETLGIDKALIEFNKDILVYNIEVENHIQDVIISSLLTDPKSIYILGNRTETLKEGLNVIKVSIQAENGDIRTYTINITRKLNNEQKLKDTSIKELIINGKKIKDITQSIDMILKNNKPLNINVITSNINAKCEIIGNKNLKDGSKVIIKVTSEDYESTKEYEIKIKIQEEKNNISNSIGNVTEKKGLSTRAIVIFILGIVVFIAGIIKYNFFTK